MVAPFLGKGGRGMVLRFPHGGRSRPPFLGKGGRGMVHQFPQGGRLRPPFLGKGDGGIANQFAAPPPTTATEGSLLLAAGRQGWRLRLRYAFTV
jgi:hypothetical protein